MDEPADKWLLAQTKQPVHGVVRLRRYDFNVCRNEAKTWICGAYWRAFLREHVVVKGDYIKMEIDHGEEEDDEAPATSYPAHVVLSVFDINGEKKPRVPLPGMILELSSNSV